MSASINPANSVAEGARAANSEERLTLIMEHLTEGLFVADPEGNTLFRNRMALELHHCAGKDEHLCSLAEIRKDYVLLTVEGKRLPFEDWPMQRILRGETLSETELTLCNLRDKWTRVLSHSGVLVRDQAGKPLMGLLTMHDITARADTEKRLQLAVDIAHLGSWEWSVAENIVYFSPQWKKLLGLDDHELPDRVEEWSSRLHPSESEQVLAGIRSYVQNPRESLQLEYRMRHRDGSYRWMITQAIASLDAKNRSSRLIGTMLDVTKQKQVEQRVREAAQHDVLTGLPNRALIFEYAGHLLAAANRKHSRGALLFIDLDRFKPVNDLYGHEIGDRLLKEVSRRLTACVRHEDVIGRIGGDEFVIVLPYLSKGYSATTVAEHVLNAMLQPFQIGELDLSIGASIGISLYPQHGNDVDTLLHAADLAMYHVKERGRGAYHVYTPDLISPVDVTSSIEARLKDGLMNSRFNLLYQPVIDVDSGQLIGAEALLRLPAGEDEGIEAISPERFIPVAESTGMIAQIGDWVATEICRQQGEWRRLGLPPVVVAMNVSPLQFRQRGFVSRLLDIVHSADIEPGSLQIEINESAVMESVDDAIETLSAIHDAGISIALDDFGTGYSSLNYLSLLPLDKLKVDQSIVHQLTNNKSSQTITEVIIALGKSLSLEIVGEGIESEQELDYLRLRGCHLAQGNYFSQPLPADEFVNWCRERKTEAVLRSSPA
jgi:diguanylate cyclase (GGDEF)-like protein/PAS domain S-box-containing protein